MDKQLDKIENDLLSHVNWSGKSKLWLGFLFLLLFVCLYFYYTQLRDGLGVTAMRDYVSWGIYISNFVFFVATSLVGMLIGSVLGLLNKEWMRPIGRIAEIIAVAFAMVAGLIIITDMGRPDRLLNVFIHGRIQSPIVWDIVVVNTYVFVSLLILYIPLIPDIHICRNKLTGLPKIQQKIYKLLSLGWADTPAQYSLIKQVLRVCLILIIPLALAIHTVTSWLFAMTLRPGWDSEIFGPYFVAGAFVAGSAAVVIAMFIFRKQYKLQDYITDFHFDKMGKLLVLVGLVYVYFNINEIIVPAYKLKEAAAGHLTSMLYGHESIMFWMIQIFGLLLPIILMMFKPFRKPLPMFTMSLFVLAAAWLKRYLIVIPIQLHPHFDMQNVPESFMTYSPTTPEIMITVGSFVLVLIIITILSKVFPIVPIWEMKKELENK